MTLAQIKDEYNNRLISRENKHEDGAVEFEFHGFDDNLGKTLSNFSTGHPIFIDGQRWKSINHYYQAVKFTDASIQDQIRETEDPFEASWKGKNRQWGEHLRYNWDDQRVEYMHRGLAAKFMQNVDAWEVLSCTEDHPIICYNSTDPFWGYPGCNQLGKLLVKVREQLKTMHARIQLPGNADRLQEVQRQNADCIVFCFYGHGENGYDLLSTHASTPFFCGCLHWKTANHHFQSCKFDKPKQQTENEKTNTEFKEFIQSRTSSIEATWTAWAVDKEFDKLSWDCCRDLLMETTLFHKFLQHLESKKVLLSTGSQDLLCVCPSNTYWGVNYDGVGSNRLGNLLMKVRTSMRLEPITKVDLKANGTAFLVYNVLSKAECIQAIQETEAQQYEPLPQGMYGERNNERVIVDDARLAKTLWDRMHHFLPLDWEEKKNGRKWKMRKFNERFRYCKYTPGQYFQKHLDGEVYDDDNLKSWWTINIYLNSQGEDFRGGDTSFFESRHGTEPPIWAVTPLAGMALVFTQTNDQPHSGEPVLEGVKYITRTDAMYCRND